MSETETTAPVDAGRLAEARRQVLGRLLRGEVKSPAPRAGIARAGGGPEHPVSHQQAQLLFLHELQPESPFYNLATAHRVSAATDLPLLERALTEIVRRHEALRTVFRWVDGEPRQVVRPPFDFHAEVEELRGADGEAATFDAAREKVREWSSRPFDLAEGPLFRCTLGRVSDADYLLVFTCHHLVSDGWSLAVVMRELAELYVAFGRGESSPLPEPRIHYPDYAVWQRAHLADGALERQLAFWTEHLRGAPASVDLPCDRPRPRVQRNRGAMHRFLYPDTLLERLNAMARETGATLNMVFLAGLNLVLQRYAGQDDIVVGAGLGNRNREELEQMVGYLVQPGAVRTRLDGDPGFREAVRRVRASVLEAEAHQEVPFHRVVDALDVPRDPSRNPLFQVMYVHRSWVRVHQVDARLRRALELRPFYEETGDTFVETGAARFDMLWTMGEGSGGMAGSVEYSTDLFDAATVARMEAQLRAILEAGSAHPDTPVSRLPLLSDADRAALEAWNRTEADHPADRCIHQLFAEQADRTPDAVALVHEAGSLTYRALNERANRLAHRLIGLGVGPEVRVGVCLERGAELVVALLAVLKAGGAYLPLDPAYPAARLALTLADAAAPVLVTRDSLRALLPAREGMSIVPVDGDAAAIAAEPADDPRTDAAPGNLAYLIYTSGSTGVPKGVAIEHRSAVAMLAWAWGAYPAEEMSGVLASTSVCFDLSVFELFAPLTRGGRVILVENALALPTSAAADQVRLINTVPSAISALLRADGIPAGVTTVNLAGEPLSAELVDALYARGVERVYDLYGPSEDTTYSTGTLRRAGGPATIGGPLPNTRAHVLDAALRPVPVGVPGELYLGGRGVTRGYLGRPGLTASRYLPDHLAGEPGARLYRTGDRVRRRADGALEYLGRLDQQVKIRGFRIEPGEIEAVLRRAPGVAECAVVPREDEPGDRRLVAYVVGPADADALRAHLRTSLPEYMVPAAFVPLDHLPLTPNGKLDRSALPAPAGSGPDAAYLAPRTPVEEALAAIWGEVLGRERVGVRESFFDAGGHSLLATRVALRIQQALDAEVGVVALFEAPTVEQLAERVESVRRAGLPSIPPIVPAESAGPLPLACAQERLWLLQQLEEGSHLYNVPLALRLSGALDRDALERAIGEIVRRHEPLRTVFGATEDGPVQVIRPFAGFALAVDDLSALDPARREAEAERRVAAEAVRPFDLAAGPLFRAMLLRMEVEEHVLVLCIHHTVCDGWSLGVLHRELSALYAAFREAGASPLPPLPVRYADYAVWQRAQLRGDALNAQLAYWRRRLAGAPALLALPTDHPRPEERTYAGASERVELDGELLARLRALGRGEGATLYMVLLAGFQVLLGRYAGTDDVVVGGPIAGRTRRELEGLIGMFVNTLVLRTDLSGGPSFRQALRRVREATLGAYQHQDVPFEQLVEELQPERSLGHSPLFQVVFGLQNAPDAVELPGLAVREVDAPLNAAKFDLALLLTVDGAGVRGAVSYRPDLWERATIQRMIQHLHHVLEQVSADADVLVPDIVVPAQLSESPPASDDGDLGPRTPVEETLAAIWAEVLGRERIGVRDDFFALGGQSVQATRIAVRIREALEVDVGLAALFRHPTIESLAAALAHLPATSRPGPVRRRPAATTG